MCRLPPGAPRAEATADPFLSSPQGDSGGGAGAVAVEVPASLLLQGQCSGCNVQVETSGCVGMKIDSFEPQSPFKTLTVVPCLSPTPARQSWRDGPSSWHCSLPCSLLQGNNQQPSTPPLTEHFKEQKKSILHHLLG